MSEIFLATSHQNLVGAGIARPSPTDDTAQPQRIVPADIGRAITVLTGPAPTRLLFF
ncbi:MAG: hypothetical protein FWD97_05940 [Defluviitaleaceae bacterium]|nr:hypothetical protein [Defluviitaleaceae bacterium]